MQAAGGSRQQWVGCGSSSRRQRLRVLADGGCPASPTLSCQADSTRTLQRAGGAVGSRRRPGAPAAGGGRASAGGGRRQERRAAPPRPTRPAPAPPRPPTAAARPDRHAARPVHRGARRGARGARGLRRGAQAGPGAPGTPPGCRAGLLAVSGRFSARCRRLTRAPAPRLLPPRRSATRPAPPRSWRSRRCARGAARARREARRSLGSRLGCAGAGASPSRRAAPPPLQHDDFLHVEFDAPVQRAEVAAALGDLHTAGAPAVCCRLALAARCSSRLPPANSRHPSHP